MKVPPFHWWRTVFFLIPAIAVYTMILGSVSLLSTLVDRRGYTAHRCAQWWSRLILWTTGVRVTVRGTMPPVGASYVFASNHQSIYDVPVIFSTLPNQLRIIAKASLGSIPFLGWHLRLAGHLLVDRENPGNSVFKKMQRMVGQGASLIIFPEGTRSADGAVARFRAPAFLLAIESGLPVVPISVSGTRLVMLKGHVMTCPGEVTFTVHEPISTVGMTRGDARTLAARVQAVVAGGVA